VRNDPYAAREETLRKKRKNGVDVEENLNDKYR
jgi:hypothetical protein